MTPGEDPFEERVGTGTSREWRTLWTGALVAGVARALLALCAVAISALLARLLPQELLGGYFLALHAVTTLALLAMLGTSSSLQRLLAVATESGTPGAVRSVMLRALQPSALAFLGICVALPLIWRPLMETWLDAGALAPLWALVIALIATQVIDVQVSVFFRATGRTRLGLLLLDLPRQALFVLALGALWWEGWPVNLEFVLLVRVGITAATACVGSLLVVRSLGSDGAAPAPSSPTVGEIVRTSLPMLVHVLSFAVLTGMDLWILASFAGTADVGIYGVALRLAALLSLVLVVFNLVIPPMIATMHAQGRIREMESLLRRVSTLGGWAAAGLLAACLWEGRELIELLFGEAYESSFTPLLVLALGQAFNVAVGSPGWILNMTGNQVSLMRIALGAVAVKAVVAWFAISHWGILGAAAATCAVMIGQNLVVMLAAARLAGVRTWPYLNPLAGFRNA